MVLLNLIPLGLLLTWQMSNRCRIPKKSARSWASFLVSIILVIFHLTHIAWWAVYIVTKQMDPLALFEVPYAYL